MKHTVYTAHMGFKPPEGFQGLILDATWKNVQSGKATALEAFLAPRFEDWKRYQELKKTEPDTAWEWYALNYITEVNRRAEQSKMAPVISLLCEKVLVIKCYCGDPEDCHRNIAVSMLCKWAQQAEEEFYYGGEIHKGNVHRTAIIGSRDLPIALRDELSGQLDALRIIGHRIVSGDNPEGVDRVSQDNADVGLCWHEVWWPAYLPSLKNERDLTPRYTNPSMMPHKVDTKAAKSDWLAFHMRDTAMIDSIVKDQGDVVFFWNRKSPGTKACIGHARKVGAVGEVMLLADDNTIEMIPLEDFYVAKWTEKKSE